MIMEFTAASACLWSPEGDATGGQSQARKRTRAPTRALLWRRLRLLHRHAS